MIVALVQDDIFGRRAESAPDAIAAEFGGERLRYDEFAARSAWLAAELSRRGVGRGAIVGVALRPCLELPVAVSAIVRAGAAWLPLDPGYPAERLRFMIEDSGVKVVLGEPGLAGTDVEVLDPAVAAAPSSGPGEVPGQQPDPDDLAYVIYTSGSTGQPKPVAVTHAGLANMARAQHSAFGVTTGDRVLQFAPTSFDASVFEMTMALHAGATLVLAARADIAPGPGLADFLRDKRISHVTLPPSVLATLPSTTLPDLTVLVCAGEALPGHLVDTWQPGRRMFNAYGPTEVTVWATLAEVVAGTGKPTIGMAVDGVRAMVVDSRLRPVPAGGQGELAIGGRGVARGYLGRPALTAKQFVPDPWSREPGGRMYLTGDRVTLRPDGNLEFVGRIDHQAKIRGFRVEPDEIAHRLADCPGVTDAVVIVREAAAGPELVGYATGSHLDPAMLRADLARWLPSHMVPSVVVVLDSMPLTPSGKIDREALPVPRRDPAVSPGRAPRTPTEQAVADLVSTLLGIERVSTDDSFFALGGHSLLAGRLAARVRDELGRELPLEQVYQTPTIEAMARAIDMADATVAVPPLRAGAAGPGDPVPLSFPQQRIWFLEELSPGNPAYRAQAALELRGPLDADVLQRVLTEIVRRHEAMRTAFEAAEGVPAQTVLPPMPVPLPVADLTRLTRAEREHRRGELIAEAMREPFDLAAPPLVRWLLIRLSERSHTLVHVEHHLIHDGWSYALFLRELQALYCAFVDGQPSPLPEPTVRYADFVRWQRDWLRGGVLDAYLRHWTAELADSPAALELPTDRPRPLAQSFAGAAQRIDLPAHLCRALRRYSQEHQVTLFATMLSGFAVLMSRYSGQQDVVIGSGMADRRLAEIEQMIGMVVNTVPLRVDLAGQPDFDLLTRRVQAVIGRAQQWQDVPLDRLVAALAPVRDPSRNPLFQVMFSFHDSHIPELRFAGLRGSVLELHNGSAKTDLNIVVIPRAEQRAGHGIGDDTAPITLIWEYATDLFDGPSMSAMAGHFSTLLAAAVASPGTACERLPLMTEAESRSILAASSGPVTPFPANRTITQLFAEQAASRPDAAAIVSGGLTCSYADLDRRSGQLAQLLRTAGVGRETPVGVLLERGAEMITALLAILKAGGAYVPMDPRYPAERLSWMLADAGVPVVVSRGDLRARIAGSPARVLALDEMATELAAAPEAAADPAARPDDLAYVLFTSGSTGRPKGVLIEGSAVLRLVCETDYVSFGPDERIAQIADPSFDAFTFEVWGALLHGGAVCVIPTDVLLTSGGLRQAIRAQGVTSMFITAALYNEVISQHADAFAGMTNLLVGGEALNVAKIRQLTGEAPAHRPARLLNGYGPTETTTFAVCGLIENVPPDAASVPIGRPIANTSAYVLDRHLRPVPVGVTGELFIGGPGVGRGYANRPAQTAEVFLPDPFTGGGSRMYRTGDMVRYRRDGKIEFIGRSDGQVKIRGFRVEPGEVEAVLGSHPQIGQAVVVTEEAPSGRRLVAYVTPAGPDSVLSSTDLREYLTAKLPRYLVPGSIVRLPAIPLTSSGKVDRAALSRLDPAQTAPAGSGGTVRADGGGDPGRQAPPPSRTERELSRLFASLLGVPTVGITDDFFAIGGHSLLAMRLVAQCNEVLRADVALSDFLKAPTVAGLALAVRAAHDRRPDRAPGSPAVRTAADADERLLRRLDTLTDSEVDALLQDLAHDESGR